MRINVKFFAELREQIGHAELEVLLDETATVTQIWAKVCPDKPLPKQVLTAVNQEYATRETFVHEGDEVAFFLPVTGG